MAWLGALQAQDCAAVSDTPAASTAARPPHHSAWLLPGFDEFVVAYEQRSAILQRSRGHAVTAGIAGAERAAPNPI